MKNQNNNVFGVDVNFLMSILPNPTLRSLAAISIMFGVGIGIGHGFMNATYGTKSQAVVHNIAFTRAEYERLKLGMSLVAVEAILGRGTEIRLSTTTRVFIWKNHDGSKINASFTDGKLISKEWE